MELQKKTMVPQTQKFWFCRSESVLYSQLKTTVVEVDLVTQKTLITLWKIILEKHITLLKTEKYILTKVGVEEHIST